MPVPELVEIRLYLKNNADRNFSVASAHALTRDANPAGSKAREDAGAKVATAQKLYEHWQRLADAQAKAIEDLKPKGPNELFNLRNAADDAWGIIANVANGDWDDASVSAEWKAAAVRWRDEHYADAESEPTDER